MTDLDPPELTPEQHREREKRRLESIVAISGGQLPETLDGKPLSQPVTEELMPAARQVVDRATDTVYPSVGAAAAALGMATEKFRNALNVGRGIDGHDFAYADGLPPSPSTRKPVSRLPRKPRNREEPIDNGKDFDAVPTPLGQSDSTPAPAPAGAPTASPATPTPAEATPRGRVRVLITMFETDDATQITPVLNALAAIMGRSEAS